jgi:ABC-type sugar transport system ATPase subunit
MSAAIQGRTPATGQMPPSGVGITLVYVTHDQGEALTMGPETEEA